MTDNEALKLAVKMHNDFNALKTRFDLEFVLCTHMWCRFGSDSQISTNHEGIKEDLFDFEGETYGYEVRFITYEDDDFVLAKVDNGCGDQYYTLFLKENEVFEE